MVWSKTLSLFPYLNSQGCVCAPEFFQHSTQNRQLSDFDKIPAEFDKCIV